jgi:hypothetical protein
MTNDRDSVDKAALHKQLYALRREGFSNVNLEQLPDLMKIAARLAGSQSDDPRRQLEAAIEIAIGDLAHERKVARLWFGLDHEMRDKGREAREDAAAKARFVSVESFRTHIGKPLVEGIRSALLSRYEPPVEATLADSSENEVGPSYLSFRARYRSGNDEVSIRAAPWVAAAWVLTIILILLIIVILVSR